MNASLHQSQQQYEQRSLQQGSVAPHSTRHLLLARIVVAKETIPATAALVIKGSTMLSLGRNVDGDPHNRDVKAAAVAQV